MTGVGEKRVQEGVFLLGSMEVASCRLSRSGHQPKREGLAVDHDPILPLKVRQAATQRGQDLKIPQDVGQEEEDLHARQGFPKAEPCPTAER